MEAGGYNTASQFNSLIVSNQRIQQGTQDAHSQIMQLHSDVTSIRGTVGQIETFLLNLAPRLDRIDNRTQLLQASAGAVHTYVLADNRQGGQSIETALQHENLLARAELTSFGDRSRKAIAGNESAVTVNQSTDSWLSGENNADTAMQIRKQLVKSPSFLRDVCKDVNLADQLIVGGFVRQRRAMKLRCDCRSVRKRIIEAVLSVLIVTSVQPIQHNVRITVYNGDPGAAPYLLNCFQFCK